MPFTAGAIMAGGNIIGGYMAGEAASEAATKAYKAQMASMIRIQEMLEAIGIPSIEAQEIALKNPEYAGDLIAETLGPSALKDIKLDPRLKSAQMDALRSLQERGKVGLTAEDLAQREEILRQSAAQNQAAQQGILQSMAERGTLDSGSSLIAQLQAMSQADSRRQSEQLMSQMQSAQREALKSAANLSAGMEQAEYGRQSNLASAEDRIASFNQQQRMAAQERNLGTRQTQYNIDADLRNQEQMHNKALLQQDYQNRMAKAKTMAGIESNMGQASADRYNAIGQAEASKWSSMGKGVSDAAGAYGK